DVQGEVAVVQAGVDVQAGVVPIRRTAVDAGERTPGQQVRAGDRHRVDFVVGVVRERGVDRSGRGVDRGDVADRRAADVGEVAAVERDGVHDAVDVRGPRRERVRGGGQEAEQAVPGVAGAVLGDG